MTGKEFHCIKCVIPILLLTKVGVIPLITQGFTKPIL
nr:MAG TPA: hypothetical protein [Caudoviricetes sp.]